MYNMCTYIVCSFDILLRIVESNSTTCPDFPSTAPTPASSSRSNLSGMFYNCIIDNLYNVISLLKLRCVYRVPLSVNKRVFCSYCSYIHDCGSAGCGPVCHYDVTRRPRMYLVTYTLDS